MKLDLYVKNRIYTLSCGCTRKAIYGKCVICGEQLTKRRTKTCSSVCREAYRIIANPKRVSLEEDGWIENLPE